jgi:hypothetical protein
MYSAKAFSAISKHKALRRKVRAQVRASADIHQRLLLTESDKKDFYGRAWSSVVESGVRIPIPPPIPRQRDQMTFLGIRPPAGRRRVHAGRVRSRLLDKCSLVSGMEFVLDPLGSGSDDVHPMPLIEIAPNKFINIDHVVTVAYEPAKTGTKEVTDGSDYNLPKKVKAAAPSFIR